MPETYLKLSSILLEQGLITREQLDKAVDAQLKSPNQKIGALLVKSGAVSEKDLVRALSQQLNIPFVSKENGELKPSTAEDLTQLVPEDFAKKNMILPLFRHGEFLTVAMADPTNIDVVDNLRLITGCHINRVVATASDVEACLPLFYGEGAQLKTVIEASYKTQTPAEQVVIKKEQTENRLSLDSLVANAEKAPVINLTDLLIGQAIRDRASDIHIEPFEDHVTIRFRIDGVLREISPPDKSMQLPLISRLKILSKMDISEKRLPQDGSFTATIKGRDVDFRVSTIPTIHGEKMVLRILDRRATSMNLESMGFDKAELEKFRKFIRKPYGLILITGPTGSGKTTTLYSAMSELKGADKNIITIEDPVEYQIPGINQVPVKTSIGLTFAAGLRAFLRQDPDVMLVGEVRDLETAQICVRAALTGHMVFSTLHTNDAPSAVTRLMDIGIEPFFVSSSLLMVVGQRLVRRLCEKCKELYQPTPQQLPPDFKSASKGVYRAKGCAACAKTGYSGRLPIFEIMYTDTRLQDLFTHRASTNEIREEAKKQGMKTLQESGYKKINEGVTSIDEVVRLTMADAG